MADDRSPETMHARFLAQRIRGIATRFVNSAADLERLAAEVERAAANPARKGQFEDTRYAALAGQVVHELITTLFNSGLGGLVTDASEADLAHYTDTSGRKQ